MSGEERQRAFQHGRTYLLSHMRLAKLHLAENPAQAPAALFFIRPKHHSFDHLVGPCGAQTKRESGRATEQGETRRRTAKASDGARGRRGDGPRRREEAGRNACARAPRALQRCASQRTTYVQVRDHELWAGNPLHFQRAGPESALGRARQELKLRVERLSGSMPIPWPNGAHGTAGMLLHARRVCHGQGWACLHVHANHACLASPAGEAARRALPRLQRAAAHVRAPHAALGPALAPPGGVRPVVRMKIRARGGRLAHGPHAGRGRKGEEKAFWTSYGAHASQTRHTRTCGMHGKCKVQNVSSQSHKKVCGP